MSSKHEQGTELQQLGKSQASYQGGHYAVDEIVNVDFRNGQKLLEMVSQNRFNMIAHYIQGGPGRNPVDKNFVDYDKRSAMHVAAGCTSGTESLRVLITYEVDLTLTDKWGRTPLDCAVLAGNSAGAQLIRDAGGAYADNTMHEKKLMEAVGQQNYIEVKKYLDEGVDPRCKDYDDRTPLHLAVDNRNEKIVELLLASEIESESLKPQRVDIWAKDRFGNTPFASMNNHSTRTGIDKIRELFQDFINQNGDADPKKHGHGHEATCNAFVWIFGLMQVLFIVLIAVFGVYDFDGEKIAMHEGNSSGSHRRLLAADSTASEVSASAHLFYSLAYTYPWYMDVHVMIFIGFGFLMTFLRKFSFSAVGITFLIGAYSIQWHMIVEGLIGLIINKHDGKFVIPVNVHHLILGDFAAGAVLITYGVVLGKVTPMQMMLIATFEMIFYTINEVISLEMGVADLGGSMVIHMFGAYFGLTLSTVMQTDIADKKSMKNNASVYHSDMFAMIGTVFLWMYWPSFNGAVGVDDEKRHLAVVNTVLSLCGSCVAAFLMSHWMRGERQFCMVDIQNATLAGGVVMGTAADLYSNPGISVLIGAVAGCVTVIGYVKIQPFLERTTGLHDTCGVHNLHGMPSLIGAFFGMMVLSRDHEHVLDTYPNKKQFAFIVITLAFAVVGGAITGLLVKLVQPNVSDENLFLDKEAWEVPHEEFPYYFDHNGEVTRADDSEDTNHVNTSREINALKNKLENFEQLVAIFAAKAEAKKVPPQKTAAARNTASA